MYSTYSLTTSALEGGEWSASRFTPGERTQSNPRTGGWVGPSAGLDTDSKLHTRFREKIKSHDIVTDYTENQTIP
jgi:hypothetical protein